MFTRERQIVAWAIELPYRYDARWPLAGIYWQKQRAEWPDEQQGCRIMLFASRERARAVKRACGIPDRIVRVKAQITPAYS